MFTKSKYDVAIVGSGHNGLVAASYLSNNGLSVLVLEKKDVIGGATQSVRMFKGMDANISRYSYLISLLPDRITQELGLKFETRRRKAASYAPSYADGKFRELLVSNENEQVTRDSFYELTGNDDDYKGMLKIRALEKIFAQKVWPTMMQPLGSREDMMSKFNTKTEQKAWKSLVEEPLGYLVEDLFKDDLVRGVVFTDGKIGINTHPYDESLLQNRTFIYHVIGNGTGEWRVPVGGMGSLVNGLVDSLGNSAEICLNSGVSKINPGNPATLEVLVEDKVKHVDADYVLINAAPSIVRKILPEAKLPTNDVEGAVFKINMLLKRLPELKSSRYSARDAFTSSFHIDEGYEQMKQSYESASKLILPNKVPGEMYCHTLTDLSILGPELRDRGFQTMTLFGLDIPYGLFNSENNDRLREKILDSYFEGINQYVVGDFRDNLAEDEDGNLCIEAKTPLDLETDLGLTKGNIFHSDLSWPWTEDNALEGAWGVEIGYDNIFVTGSSAMRGGAVSGIPGHNAAMKVLESLEMSC